MKESLAQQQFLQNMKNISQNQIDKAQTPTYKPAQIKAINSDGTLNVQTKNSDTIMPNVVNRALTDLNVGDWVLLLAPQGNFANAVASINWGVEPARIGYAGAYIIADTGNGDSGLVCENADGTSKTVINADAPFTVYKSKNGNWVQVGGITADGDFCASRLTNEIDNINFYAVVGTNENNNLVFEIHQVQSDNTDVKIFQFWESANGGSVLQYGNNTFGIEDKSNNVRLFFGDDNSFVIGNNEGTSQITSTNDQVTLNALNSQVSAVVNKDGLGIVNNSKYHNFNTNPSTGELQTDGVDTWSGTLTLADGTKLTYTNGLLTGIGN